MVSSFTTIFSKLKNIVFLLIFTFIFAMFLLVVPQLNVVLGVLKLLSVTHIEFWDALYAVMISSMSVMSILEIIVLILLSFNIGVNAVLFVTYLKQYRQKLSFAGTHLTLTAMVLGMFGVGCLSCGVLLLSPLISIFGLSAAVWITQYGIVISTTGLILILYSNYLLLKKISDPQICMPLYE